VLEVVATPDDLAGRYALVAGGIALVGLGSGLYLGSRLGAGPRDGLMLGLHRRTGVSVRLARTAVEVTVVAAGALLGGTAGIGTLAFALLIGPRGAGGATGAAQRPGSAAVSDRGQAPWRPAGVLHRRAQHVDGQRDCCRC